MKRFLTALAFAAVAALAGMRISQEPRSSTLPNTGYLVTDDSVVGTKSVPVGAIAKLISDSGFARVSGSVDSARASHKADTAKIASYAYAATYGDTSRAAHKADTAYKAALSVNSTNSTKATYATSATYADSSRISHKADSAAGISGQSPYAGILVPSFDTISRSGAYSGYSTATGAPNASTNWLLWHLNSNTGTTSAYQRAASTSGAVIMERQKLSSAWGAWRQVYPVSTSSLTDWGTYINQPLLTTSSPTFGKAALGTWAGGGSAFAWFGATGQNQQTNGNSGMFQYTDGTVYLAAPAKTSLALQYNSQNQIVIDSNGIALQCPTRIGSTLKFATLSQSSALSLSATTPQVITAGGTFTLTLPAASATYAGMSWTVYSTGYVVTYSGTLKYCTAPGTWTTSSSSYASGAGYLKHTLSCDGTTWYLRLE